MGSQFNTNQATVGTTNPANQIVPPNTGRKAVVITNLTANAIYVGNSVNVTTSTGELIPGAIGASLSIPSTAAVYAIGATGASISFLDA